MSATADNPMSKLATWLRDYDCGDDIAHAQFDAAADALTSQSLSLSEARAENDRKDAENERLKGLVAGIREFPQEPPEAGEAWAVERRLEERTEQVAGLFNENRRLRAEIEKHKATRFVLDLRIRNQRRSNRDNWMIVEARGKSLRSSALHIYRRGRALMAEAKSALENCKPALADANTNPPLSDLSSLRKGAEVVGEAAAYDFVAAWHERQAKLFREMAEDDPRTAKPARDRAKEAAIHHAASAAALRNRAADDRRAALVSGSREDGAGA